MRPNIHRWVAVWLALALSCILHIGCDDGSAIKEPSPGSGGDAGNAGSDAGGALDAGTLPDGAPKDCFDDPKTHFEIINACTNAVRVPKNPTLPTLLPDGGLPPLQ